MGKGQAGFTLLEVLLALALSSFLIMGLLGFSSQSMELWTLETFHVDRRQQGRILMDRIIRDLRMACFENLVFRDKLSDDWYGRVEFSPLWDLDIRYAYYTSGDNAMKGVKNPGRDRFTGMSVALDVQDLAFKKCKEERLVSIRLTVQEDFSVPPVVLQCQIGMREGGQTDE